MRYDEEILYCECGEAVEEVSQSVDVPFELELFKARLMVL